MEVDCDSVGLDQTLDDTYFSALFEEGSSAEEIQSREEDDTFPADVKYAESLQLQEALMGGIMISRRDFGIGRETLNRSVAHETRPLKMIFDPCGSENSDTEIGQSSLQFREICAERKENESMFSNSCCLHSYCSVCVTKYVMGKLLDSVSVVTCPDFTCKTVLSLDACRPLLPKDAAELWEELLARDTVGAGQVVYCPYKNCSAMMIRDELEGEEATDIAEAECPMCHRLFCARCVVPWHGDLNCEDYQKLGADEKSNDDLAVAKLARAKKWGRCPRCKFYVERTGGCPHMRCRCGFEFCYGCGASWNSTHGGCAT